MTGRQTVFNAIVATTTTELHLFSGLQASVAAGALLLEVLGGTSANFTLDIQGKVHEAGTYTNIDYIQIYQAGEGLLDNSQLTVNDQTVRFYLIPIPAPLIQLVATFTAGSLTIHASYVHHSYPIPARVAGGSEVKTIAFAVATTSITRFTILTPTSGKKVRIISFEYSGNNDVAPGRISIYFHTGAAYLTTPANAIAQGTFVTGIFGTFYRSWPNGGGPVGAVDEVVSGITEDEIDTAGEFTLVYKEE